MTIAVDMGRKATKTKNKKKIYAKTCNFTDVDLVHLASLPCGFTAIYCQSKIMWKPGKMHFFANAEIRVA